MWYRGVVISMWCWEEGCGVNGQDLVVLRFGDEDVVFERKNVV